MRRPVAITNQITITHLAVSVLAITTSTGTSITCLTMWPAALFPVQPPLLIIGWRDAMIQVLLEVPPASRRTFSVFVGAGNHQELNRTRAILSGLGFPSTPIITNDFANKKLIANIMATYKIFAVLANVDQFGQNGDARAPSRVKTAIVEAAEEIAMPLNRVKFMRGP